jgi:hypothetical protein
VYHEHRHSHNVSGTIDPSTAKTYLSSKLCHLLIFTKWKRREEGKCEQKMEQALNIMSWHVTSSYTEMPSVPRKHRALRWWYEHTIVQLISRRRVPAELVPRVFSSPLSFPYVSSREAHANVRLTANHSPTVASKNLATYLIHL